MIYDLIFEEAMDILNNRIGWIQGENFDKHEYLSIDRKSGYLIKNVVDDREIGCVYLQFILSDNLTLEMLDEFRTEYMKISKISYLTSCSDVLVVKKFEKPKMVKQNKYDATLMNRVFYRLNHLKIQTKAHK